MTLKKNQLEILGLSTSQSQTGSFALILGEVGGNRRLPIIIGMFEAQAIAVEIEGITTNRPMTHDLFKSLGNAFQFHVSEVVISDLKEGVFFSKIFFTDGLSEKEIDARPSDAIAIAIRFGAPIYASNSVMDNAGIVFSKDTSSEENDDDDENKIFEKKEKEESPEEPQSQLRTASLETLQKMLQEAIDNEDYERAAKIRDELSLRN